MDILSVELILGVLFIGAILSFFTYRIKWISGIAAFLSSITAAIFIVVMGVMEKLPEDLVEMELLDGIQISLGITWFSYLFLACIVVISPLVLMYSLEPMRFKATKTPFYGLFMLSVIGGAGVTMARDLLSLFIFWEIMTWSALLLIGNERSPSGRAFKMYLGFGMLSAGGILALIALVASSGHGMDFGGVTAAVIALPMALAIL